MICNEADINQKPVQTPCHLAVVVRVLSSILNAPSPLAHPALTLFSYLILETLTCVLSSVSGVIKSNFHKCRHSSLSNLHLSAHPAHIHPCVI